MKRVAPRRERGKMPPMTLHSTLADNAAPTPADAGLHRDGRVRAHFDLVTRAIEALAAAPAPLDLTSLAERLGVSSSHLQRTFTDWAGVSPKRFAQFISKERALASLRADEDVLSASFAAGLSSPGRLHELTLTCEGVTPGEARALGSTITVRHGVADTWFGPALIGMTARGICHLAFVDGTADEALEDLRARWPLAHLVEDAAAAADTLAILRQPPAAAAPIRLWVSGTNFQLKVWEALLRVPEGRLVSYASLARAAGMPSAVRAVASAVAANPVAVLVPCHRVIRASGVLGQYRWGSPRKAALVGWEAARRTASAASYA